MKPSVATTFLNKNSRTKTAMAMTSLKVRRTWDIVLRTMKRKCNSDSIWLFQLTCVNIYIYCPCISFNERSCSASLCK